MTSGARQLDDIRGEAAGPIGFAVRNKRAMDAGSQSSFSSPFSLAPQPTGRCRSHAVLQSNLSRHNLTDASAAVFPW